MSNVDNNRSQAINQLFRAILTLQDIDECYRFFGDLFTVQELTAFAQRFQVAEPIRSEGMESMQPRFRIRFLLR